MAAKKAKEVEEVLDENLLEENDEIDLLEWDDEDSDEDEDDEEDVDFFEDDEDEDEEEDED